MTFPIPPAAPSSLKLTKTKVCQVFVICWAESKVLSKKGQSVKQAKPPAAKPQQQVQKLTKVNLEQLDNQNRSRY